MVAGNCSSGSIPQTVCKKLGPMGIGISSGELLMGLWMMVNTREPRGRCPWKMARPLTSLTPSILGLTGALLERQEPKQKQVKGGAVFS